MKQKKKMSIFNIDKRTAIASGFLHGNEKMVDMFLKTLQDAMEEADADPSNDSLTKEEKEDFLAQINEQPDPKIIFDSEKKIHTIDDILKKHR